MAKSLHDFVSEALKTVSEVTPEEVIEIQRSGGYKILDVREPNEYGDGHLVGAVNIPRGFLEVKADLEHYKRDESLADRTQKIVCYCGGGHRSALAAKTLMEMGFEHVRSMKEGWTGWTARGLPTTKDE
ncbi:MAG: rhodanese-like domain-containing protein [Fimbriimonas sp.]|nr:rhodanese-like domain-containing protein [Fimbriimonas sp.]